MMSDPLAQPEEEKNDCFAESDEVITKLDEAKMNGVDSEEEEKDGNSDDDGSAIHSNDVDLSSIRHRMNSSERGQSEIERLYFKLESRRENRIPVTFDIRKRFLNLCLSEARQSGEYQYRLHVSRVIDLRNRFKDRVKDRAEPSKLFRPFFQLMGYWDVDATMLKLFNHALENAEDIDSQWFYYRDFNFYDTVVVQRRRFLTNPRPLAVIYLLIFYISTAVFFCNILDDSGVCPSDPSGKKSFHGWVSAVYFASVTMSTVGYGDLTVDDSSDLRLFIATVYMILALLIGFTVFATAADAAISTLSFGTPIADELRKLYTLVFHGRDDQHLLLYQIVRRLKVVQMTKLTLLFLLYNTIGMLLARIFIYNMPESREWSWMMTFYWAVQTTTTIGYGDLDMPFNLRWFQIFYTTLGTVLVGSVFGEISNLRKRVQDTRRFYAWKRRKVSKRLIEDMKGDSSNEPGTFSQIDQYEFMVGSLLMLNKINQIDVQQIMDKFRELSGDKGFIVYSEACRDENFMPPNETQEGSEGEIGEPDSDDENLDVDVDCPNDVGGVLP